MGIFAQTEEYVEYSRHGKLLKGVESKVVRSQYEEDRLIGNHTSVWGSWWSEGRWGYKCCHSTMKQSYCTGDSGKNISNATLTLPPPNKEKKDGSSSDEEEEEDEGEEGRVQLILQQQLFIIF